MRRKSERVRELALFLIRNLVLYFLLVNSFLQLRDQLDLVFQSASFVLAVLAGLWMEKARLRIVPALVLAAVLPVALRAVFFLVFRMQRAIASGPATDFMFFYFDKDFFPAITAYAIVWLFNFLALRRRSFIIIETGLNALLIVLVFWTQAGYRLTLYSHPSIFAWALALFIVAEFFVLALANDRADRRSVLGFSWILVPLLLVFLLFLLGKYGEGAVKAGGGLMKPTLFRFDFAPFVRLESEIRTSDEAVLLFRTEGRAERFLLRRFVLSGYTPNQSFFMERGKGIDEYPAVVPDAPETFPDPGYRDRQNVSQEYFFLTIDPSSLIALNYPVRVAPLKNWKSSSFLRVYRVDSRAIRSETGPRKVAVQPPMAPDLLAFYTSGGSNDEKIRALALQVTAGESSYYGKAAAMEEYLRTNYLYSLKPGIAEDGNQLHHFLFVSKKGYCSYFAFAMALMCRSLGIPARVAVGFYVDPQSEVLNFYEVRAFQAHAWVEVYFGNLGWVEFDPTSSTPAPGEDFVPFPAPDRDRMAKLIAEILKNQTDQVEQAPSAPSFVGSASRWGTRIAQIDRVSARLWYVTLPALYALFLFSMKLLPLLPGLLAGNPRKRVKAWYRLCLVTLAGAGMMRRASESPLEHAARVRRDRGVSVAPLADLFLKASFADTFTRDDLASARAARGTFTASYRAKVAWPRRLLAIVNPLRAGRP